MTESDVSTRATSRALDLVDRAELPLFGIWIGLSLALAQLTGRVTDWFDMTDELRYEKLASAIARTHSLVPRIHGRLVESWAQLYPALIAPVFHHATAAADVRAAHVLNAWVMASACFPAFLLARRVLASRSAAYLVAVLSVAMPWILYATMLMTEVAAYPAFLWAALAIQRSVDSPSRRNDALALLGIALAFFARTALLTMVVVLPLAIAAFEFRRRRAREVLRSHDLLVVAYALLALAAVILEATGKFSRIYGIYAHYTDHADFFTTAYFGSLFEHYATFALALGILPLLVAAAWMVVRVLRPPARPEAHAFACVALLTLIVLPVQVTDFDAVYNGSFVHDRFLLYLVPLVLVATLAAVLDDRRLGWTLVVPAAVLVLGFATGAIPDFTWKDVATITPDTPASSLYRLLADATGGLGVTRLLLASLTVAFAVVAALLPHRPRLVFVVAYTAVAVPLVTWSMFDRFFGEQGWSRRPVTAHVAGTLDWVDLAVGAEAETTVVPYPTSSDWFVSQRYWRDLEFWNRSVVRDLHYPEGDVFEYTGFWFPKLYGRFDRTTGRSSGSPTRFVVQSDGETRFRISGPVRATAPSALLIDAGRRWRVDWLSSGLYDDGWTKPNVPAHLRVFAAPAQRDAEIRYLSFAARAPDSVQSRHVDATSGIDAWHGEVPSGDSARIQVRVCVPARGFADVAIATPETSAIPGDARSLAMSSMRREGGVAISAIALADEVGGACTPP